jgi:hypothetical protein
VNRAFQEKEKTIMDKYPTFSHPSSKEILAREITALIKSLSRELGLGSVDIKEVLDSLRSKNWAKEHDDRQLLLPFAD